MALTKVKLISDGVIVQGNLHSSHGITTAHIGEGSNLYYTDARVDTRVGNLNTGNLPEGSNLYYTDARADARIAAASTSDLSEGTNLYYTDARADARVALIVDSSPSTLNTLNELAAALGDDPNFATTTAASIGTKLPLAGGTLTGNLNAKNILFATSALPAANNPGINLRDTNNEFYFQSGSAHIFNFIRYDNRNSMMNLESTGINVTGGGTFSGDIMPAAENLYDIGSASVRWEDIWADQVYGRSVYVDTKIIHAGDDDNFIEFGTDTISISKNATFSGTISSNSISTQGMITVTQNDIGTGESVGLRIIRSGGAQVWNITSGQTGVDNTTFNIRNSTSNTNVLGLNASNNSATFAGTITAGAATLTSATSPLLLTLNSTANGYGGILFQYGGATKGLSYYNSNMMIFGGEAGTATRLQAGGQYVLHADATNQNVHIGGTGNSTYKLQVTGTSFTSANAQFQSSVGIGMAPSADAKLEILNGNFRIRGSSANVIQLSNTAGNTRAQLGNYGNEGDLSLYRSNNVKTVYISSYYDGYINNDTNKFGFGTTTPSTKLHVQGPTGTKNRSTTGGSSVYETTKYFGVNGNTTANISIDTPTVFPPMGSGGFILVEVSASGYGNSGSNGLVFSYITGGYGGHYAAVNQPYHPVVITANSMQAGTCTWYNPNATTIGITIATTNSAGINGLMRVKVTTTY
ncbi:hypothetical protein N9B68_01910 [bacterium]|nr:hypothetical protein [bacterium]